MKNVLPVDFSYDFLRTRPSHLYKDQIDACLGDLRQKFGITFFYFQRRVGSEVLLHIVSDRKWQLIYMATYYTDDTFQQAESILNKDYYLWGLNPVSNRERQMHTERIEVYKIPPGISFIRPNDAYIDTFSYSSNRFENPVREIMLLNPQLMIWEKHFLKEIHFILKEHKLNKLSQGLLSLADLKFSKKELLAIRLLCSDYETSEISRSVCVTRKTAQKIIDSAKEKLNCKTRTGLVVKATQLKLIMPS